MKANRALAELKGRAAAIPKQGILIDTLALQETKGSSVVRDCATPEDYPALFRLLERRDSAFEPCPELCKKRSDRRDRLHPPQEVREIESAIATLERFINIDELTSLDPVSRHNSRTKGDC